MKISPFKVEEWMNRYEEGALYDLTTTCIKPLTLNELYSFGSEKNLSEIFEKSLGYGDITGSCRLKTAIKELYENKELSNITITHGAIGANQLIFLSMLEPDDEVISVVPTYQQHYSIPESLGAKVKLYFLKEQYDWIPNPTELAQMITPKTKLICLNNPNNPTGAVIPNRILEEIIGIAKVHKIWILSDEVYRGLNLIGKPYSQSVADMYEKGISVGSMSKTYSLPGLRVGWIVARDDLINEINHQRQYNTISVSGLDDYFAALALENKDYIQERNFKILRNGHEILTKWLQKEKLVNCVIPNGGTTALIKYNIDMASRNLCRRLQNRTGVALLPGETMEMEGYVRIGFSANALAQALDIFSSYLQSL